MQLMAPPIEVERVDRGSYGITIMRTPAFATCLLSVLAACGGPAAPPTESGTAASATEVEISGRASDSGTRGSVLVFAFAGTPGAALADSEPLSVGTLDADGTFALTLPPTDALTLAFLADGSNDGVIDGGDPVALLSDARLNALQGGEVVRISDLALDFHSGQARVGNIEVRRPGESPPMTPTAVPAG